MKKCSTRTAGHTVCRNTAKLAFQYFFKASGFRVLNPFSAALSNRELASITAFDDGLLYTKTDHPRAFIH